ncbi:MAG: HIRAN domain-containing protein [Bacteroidales bacterium]|jgi:hypothetical protein|nr:HIRAN domain-containing protein [Bacteroidales bacterium]
MISRNFLTTHIAGFAYYDGIDVFDSLKIGTRLSLKAEPENPKDCNAVAIFFDDTMLGYIPASKNELLSLFLRLGHTNLFEVRINQVDPVAYSERQIGIVVRIVNVSNLPNKGVEYDTKQTDFR